MKVAIITDLMDDRPAGMGQYTRSLVEAMVKQAGGDNITLVHAKKGGDPLYEKARELVVKPGSGRFARKFVHYPRALALEGFDVVHYPDYFGPFMRRRPYRTAETIYDLVPFVHPGVHTWDVKFTMRRVFPWFIQGNVDLFMCISESTKRDLARYVPKTRGRIRVTPLAADPIYRPVKDPQTTVSKLGIEGPYVLNVGTLEPRKNQAMLIRAFSAAKRDGRLPHKLVIAGKKGWMWEEVERASRESGLGKDLVMLDYVPRESLPALYSGADVMAYPSMYEGFGLPPLEAMACGCPVVASNTSSMPEVVGDAGIMLDPADERGLARTLMELCTDEERRRGLRRKGMARAAAFSWERTARLTLEGYRSLAGK